MTQPTVLKIIRGGIDKLLLTGVLTILCSGQTNAAGVNPLLKSVLADVMLCYGRGIDTIGEASTRHQGDGERILAKCFSEDAEFRVWLPGGFDSRFFPDPDLIDPIAIGPNAWAAFSASSYDQSGYDYTQHLLTNINVEAKGRSGKVTAYLEATFVIIGDGFGQAQCVVETNGIYSLRVEKRRGRWLATSLDLVLLASGPRAETAAGC